MSNCEKENTAGSRCYGHCGENLSAQKTQQPTYTKSPLSNAAAQKRSNTPKPKSQNTLLKFILAAHKYVDIEELDPYATRVLVQVIYVDAPDKSSGKRRQNIHIKYNGIGFIPLNELM